MGVLQHRSQGLVVREQLKQPRIPVLLSTPIMTATAHAWIFELVWFRQASIDVWIRGYYAGGGSNSCWVDLDDDLSTSAETVGFPDEPPGEDDWSWQKRTFSAVPAGVNILHLWMREAGTVIDKIVISSNPGYDPRK